MSFFKWLFNRKPKELTPDEKEQIYTKDFFDMILPPTISFKANYYIVGDSYRCTWVIHEYAPSTEEQALLSQLADRNGVTLRIFNRLVEPFEQRKILQNAERKNKLQSTGNNVSETIEAQGNLQDVTSLITMLWFDRRILWNAVERTEKAKDSRLARELVVALPVELGKEQWINLLTDYVQSNFVAEGMCADVAIHDTDGHNPHAHIMLTVRPLDDKGKWQYKTEKEYLCKRNGEEKGFTAAEFLQANAQGWEKQYQYYVGKKKVYLPPSEAERHGYERVNKYPKSTKYGRQNPITARWNSDEQLVVWRENWAQTTNKYLDEANRSDAHIDHRSHAARGIDDQPTIHEGYVAQAMERRGLIADRCELNRQIKADNAVLLELKAAFTKISQAVKNTVPALAEAMESLREKAIIINYHIRHTQIGKRSVSDFLKGLKAAYESYKGIVKQISTKKKERKELQKQKKSTPVLKVITHRNFDRRIAELTEEIEELKFEKARLLEAMERTDDKDVATINDSFDRLESALAELDEREKRYTVELNEILRQYNEGKEQAKEFDDGEFGKARLDIRSDKEYAIHEQLSKAYGDRFDPLTLVSSRSEIDGKLDDAINMPAVREYVYQQRRQAHQQQRNRKSHEQER